MEQKCRLKKQLTVKNFCEVFGGKWQHSSHTERYFYDESYQLSAADCLAVHTSGRCYQIEEGQLIDEETIVQSSDNAEDNSQQTVSGEENINFSQESAIRTSETGVTSKKKNKTYKWKCTKKCNIRRQSCRYLRQFILQYNSKTNAQTKIRLLQQMDDCYMREKTGLLGHSIACLENEACKSVFHHIKMLSSHHTSLRNFVKQIYFVRRPIILLKELNDCLLSGTIGKLKQLVLTIKDLFFDEVLLSAEEEEHTDQPNKLLSADHLLRTYGKEMAKFEKQASELPLSVCVSCRRTNYKKQVKTVHLASEVDNDATTVWAQLMLYLLIEEKFDVAVAVVICLYCFSYVNTNKIPPRSVLNGMDLDPVPSCLQNLNPCEVFALQFIHPFKVILRLQTKTKRVSTKELTKGLKGKIIYLPIDLDENVETLGLQDNSTDLLQVVVNGVPTKSNRIWQELMNIPKLKLALEYLKMNNKLYQSIDVDTQLRRNIAVYPESFSKGQFRKLSEKQSKEIYEQYTVQPLNPGQVAGDSLQVYQMEKTTAPPVSVFDVLLEEKAFPMLFPNGRGGRLDERPERISTPEYQITRLYCSDSRFRRNMDYIFHLLYVKDFGTLCHAVAHTLSTGTSFKHLTAQQLIEKIKLKDQVLETNLTNLFACIRGTKAYWSRQHSELRCMLFHLGPPTWFLTLSCAEYSWNDLADYIRISNPDVVNIDKMTNGQLCAMDPVLVTRFFNHRFAAILQFILNKTNPPIGEVVHYYWRKEYQLRGAPHVHMVLWVKDAPKFGKDSPEKIMEFIKNYATCQIPNDQLNMMLRELILQFQQHICSSYCLRKFKSKGNVYSKCRFGFPKPTHATGLVNDYMSSVRHKVTKKSPKNTYYLPRDKESSNINDYNPSILSCWKANMDIQFVADEAEAIARYVTGYITKAEKSREDALLKDYHVGKSAKETLMATGLQSLSNRLCGTYEASDRLLGSPLYGRSVAVKWVSLGPTENRKRVLKSHKELEEMAEKLPDCRDILKNNLPDTYYPDRCKEMENMCLFEVAEHFTYKSAQPDIQKKLMPLQTHSGCLAYHAKACLINHHQLTMDTEEKKENYYFCLLQLFKPWRNEKQLKGKYKSYEESYKSVQDEITTEKMERYILKLNEVSEKSKKIDAEIAKATPESSQNSELGSQRFVGQPNVLSEVQRAMLEVEGAMENIDTSNLDVDQIKGTLNKGQCEIYSQLVTEIDHSFAHKKGFCECTKNHQVLMYISGEAGTGKSYLIHALRAYMLRITGNVKSCAVTAPTGLAAFNVNGVTLHRLLMLPVEQDSRIVYKELSSESAQAVARVLRNVDLLIIDEVSMVSNLMLAFIHLRLTETLRTSPKVAFAGKHVIVFGDLLQLTPVKGQPVFRTLSSKDANMTIGSMGNCNLWHIFTYYELTQNMRQAEDLKYSEMLQGIRVGVLTDEVKAVLQTRMTENILEPGKNEYDLMSELLASGSNTVALMCTIAECNEFNRKMQKKENTEMLTVESIDIVEASVMPPAFAQTVQKRLKDLEKKQNDTGGLERNLELCINSRVMLRRNLNIEFGLVNGAMGHITAFILDDTKTKPMFIEVQFLNLKDPTLIPRTSARFKLFKDVYVRRSQFPLCAAYAITVHKSQGLSLDSAIVNVGSTVFNHGIVYVALSRIKQLSGLYITKFDPSKVTADSSCVTEYNRLRDLHARHLGNYEVPKQTTNKRVISSSIIENKKEDNGEQERTILLKEENKGPQHGINTVEKFEKTLSGFKNDSGVECYCNSTLQFIFELTSLCKNMEKKKTKELSSYLTDIQKKQIGSGGKALPVAVTRHIVHQFCPMPEFILRTQQDAHEFMTCLFQTLESEGVRVRQSLETSYSWKEYCHSCQATQTPGSPHELCIILPLPEKGVVKFTDLLENANHGSVCPNCGGQMTSSLFSVQSNEYVILMFKIYNENGIRKNIAIKNFHHSRVTLEKQKFQTKALILHEGNTIKEGHYTAFKRRENYWLKCNDSVITKESRAPRNLQNVYLLLLQKKLTAEPIFIPESNAPLNLGTPLLIVTEEPKPTSAKKVLANDIETEQALDITDIDSIPQKKKRKTHHGEKKSDEGLEIPLSGFINESGIDCYCNSTLQFIFEIDSLCKDMAKKPTKNLANYLTETQKKQTEKAGTAFSVSFARQIVQQSSPECNYGRNEQQDAHEFLTSIFNILEVEGIAVRQSLEISYSWKEYCSQCEITQTPRSPHELSLLLPLPNDKQVNFTDLLENAKHGSKCSNCEGDMTSSLVNTQTNEYIILMFGIYNERGNRKKISIKEFNYSDVSLGTNKFETKSLIVHEGKSIKSGHFITWKKREKYWLKCNDNKVTKEKQPPNHLQNVYLLLLKRK